MITKKQKVAKLEALYKKFVALDREMGVFKYEAQALRSDGVLTKADFTKIQSLDWKMFWVRDRLFAKLDPQKKNELSEKKRK
jgi:hypothetical protein